MILALKQGSLLGNLELFMFVILLGKYDRWLPTNLRDHQDESVFESTVGARSGYQALV